MSYVGIVSTTVHPVYIHNPQNLFDFCKKDAVIDSLNEELGVLDAGIAVTDYELDEEAGYIQFKIA